MVDFCRPGHISYEPAMATTVYSTNMRPLSSVIRSLPLINPEAFRVGVYQWETSSDLGFGLYICQKNLLAMASTLHTYIHIHIHMCTHTYTYIIMYTYRHKDTHIRTYKDTHTRTHTRTLTNTRAHTHAHIHAHTHSIQHCIACSKHTELSYSIIQFP